MEGYDHLAAHMGSHVGLTIFRRFGILNARNLLILQAEIMDCQRRLLDVIATDRNSRDPEREQFSCNIRIMKGPHDPPSEEKQKQWDITLELRRLLKDYSM